ncbi:conserved hypothetical protein [Ignisphaera aggregans DSM 17230]|uniref:Uncharacterized protein n=1 Tax=Ignisphaera aggregans (strain DSM 17230 / JCM 13409 / AQ1.S1) TaxID=583356 RepID=E0SRZ6_IGNAA|nr:conserved hypothetical protein [Ignisphaera aggregans DSM 17230]
MYKQKTLFGLTLALIAMVLGTALAMWSETLMVNVAVNTGEVKVKFSDWYCSDKGADPQAEGFHNTEGKDVASCDISVEVRDGEGNPIKLLVTIDNAYPGYSVDVGLVIDNIGTIPVKLLSSSISEYDKEALSVSLTVPEDTQIDPGYNSTYTLHITVLQGAAEKSTYTFEVTLTFAQWNEVP